MSLDGPIAIGRTPRFGVCVDTTTQTKSRCVLAKSACAAGPATQAYRAPFETPDAACEDPDAVEVGRCTSSLDDRRCGPFESACGTKSPFYDAIDPQCSIVDDDETAEGGSRTTYPACEDNYFDEWQCVLDGDECHAGERVWYAKWVEDWGTQPCHCEDVPTGICYAPSTPQGDLTPKNSFCAVSRADCPSNHSWMAARAFLKSDLATFECRLCDKHKIGPQGSAYAAGGCLKSGVSPLQFGASEVEVCALESVDCAGGSMFVSSAQLERQGLMCPIQNTRNWGICASQTDGVDCTNKASSCQYSFRFEVGYGPECDVYFSASGLPTYYPYCAPRTDNDDRDWRVVRCVWDQSECEPGKERWEEARLPNQAWFKGCTCEDVFTGVCKDPSTKEYHCGVSAQACEDPSSYVEQHSLEARGIDMECQLCSPASRPPPPTRTDPELTSRPVGALVPPPSDPQPSSRPVAALAPVGVADVPMSAPSPIQVVTATPTVPSASSKVEALYFDQRWDPETGEIIGIIVAGLVFCIAIVWGVVRASRTNKDTQERTFQGPTI